MPSDMTASPLPDLILYTRAGCGLCDETRLMLQGLLEDRAARGARLAQFRERDIATLAARGEPSKAIAERLFLSVRTVNNHLQNVYSKLGVGSRRELAAALADLDTGDE